jgi:hypothetical protein
MPWTCSCGATGNGRFCEQCGQHVPIESPWKHAAPYLQRIDPARTALSLSRIALTVLGILAVIIVAAILSSSNPAPTPQGISDVRQESAPAATGHLTPSRPPLLTELRGGLARRRELDLSVIRDAFSVLNSALAKGSPQGKILCYCLGTVRGAERVLDPTPETEYAIQEDGTVSITSGRPPRTPEQRFCDGERAQRELMTGGGPVVQDCASSLFWFGTWNNQPMPPDEKFMEIIDETKADLKKIDETLDPRLIEFLPQPDATQRVSPNPETKPIEQVPDHATIPSPVPTNPSGAVEPRPILPSQPLKPPVPTSGILHVIIETEHGNAVFENLPPAQLKFTFDHNAWQATIHKQPNGTKTLVMHSLKSGSRISCDVRWEIVQ